MEAEIIRAHAAALADASIGINAMLAALPLDEPSDLRPKPLEIYTSVEHGPIARRAINDEGSGLTFPALAIYVADAATLEQVRTTTRDGHFPVALSHIELDSDSARGNLNACYTMRALARFFTRFARNDGAAFRVRNGVQLIEPVEFKQSPVFQRWDAGLVQTTLVVTWHVRDTDA